MYFVLIRIQSVAAAAPRLPCPRAARGTAWGHSEALRGNPRIAVRRDGKALQRRALEGVVVSVSWWARAANLVFKTRS